MKTIKLTDYDLQKLNDGRSTTATDKDGEVYLVTFKEGGRKYVECGVQ